MMEHSVRQPAPVHLWIVGVLALLWNGFGAYDYTMTRSQGAPYIETMMPGADGTAFMAYIDAFPIWASAGWALGVWGGLAGAVLLLARSRWAVLALGLSLVGAISGIVYQLAVPHDDPALKSAFNTIVPYLIIAVALALFLYARRMRERGVLA